MAACINTQPGFELASKTMGGLNELCNAEKSCMKVFNKIGFFIFFTFCVSVSAYAQEKMNWKKLTVLVYTKNGKGYVHDNIPSAVACIQKFGKQYGFRVDTSSNALVMSETNLEQY